MIPFQQLMTSWPDRLRWHRWRAPEATALTTVQATVAPAVPQCHTLLYDLKENFCDPEAGLIVRDFPSSLSIQDRELRNDKSTFTTKESDSLCSAVTTARKVLRD